MVRGAISGKLRCGWWTRRWSSAYLGKRRIVWFEVFAGEKAKDLFGSWLPDQTVDAFRDLRIGIKGPLTTPIGGGIRSLNVALRQILDLYACVRPVKYYKGIPSPVKHPDWMNMVIFRENTEDVYSGIEWREGTAECQKTHRLHQQRDAGHEHQEEDPRGLGHRHQADFDYRHQAPGAPGH